MRIDVDRTLPAHAYCSGMLAGVKHGEMHWMRTSADFHANPIGVFVDPAKVAGRAAAGDAFSEIHRRAMAGELSPPRPPLELPGKEQA